MVPFYKKTNRRLLGIEAAVLIVIILLMPGCAKKTHFRFWGIIRDANGSALKGELVMEPMGGSQTKHIRVRIEDDGSFEVYTLPGVYRVIVNEAKSDLPPLLNKYRHFDITPLKYSVSKDEWQNETFISVTRKADDSSSD